MPPDPLSERWKGVVCISVPSKFQHQYCIASENFSLFFRFRGKAMDDEWCFNKSAEAPHHKLLRPLSPPGLCLGFIIITSATVASIIIHIKMRPKSTSGQGQNRLNSIWQAVLFIVWTTIWESSSYYSRAQPFKKPSKLCRVLFTYQSSPTFRSPPKVFLLLPRQTLVSWTLVFLL